MLGLNAHKTKQKGAKREGLASPPPPPCAVKDGEMASAGES